jgi:hypothetical protein
MYFTYALTGAQPGISHGGESWVIIGPKRDVAEGMAATQCCFPSQGEGLNP